MQPDSMVKKLKRRLSKPPSDSEGESDDDLVQKIAFLASARERLWLLGCWQGVFSIMMLLP
jgi:hypothetical protein